MALSRVTSIAFAVAALAGTVAFASPAKADWDGWHRGWRHGHWYRPWGPPVYYAPRAYYAPPPVYYAPPPVVYAPPPAYYPPGVSFGFAIR